ncbi:hypothetical protein [Streptomyces globisporus]|uniref:hypothetical protein n=1 Tax=Streptomyces globisporus TaxID=1908 RepID=UPI0004C761A3|nr:hypothetical protein [Streptomyces globisporus]
MSSRPPDEFRLGASPYGRGPGHGEEPEDPRELLRRARWVRRVWGAAAAEAVGAEARREAGRGRPGVEREPEPEGARAWPHGRPEPYGRPGRYQVDVYGEVGGTGTGPRGPRRREEQSVTRVQGCV